MLLRDIESADPQGGRADIIRAAMAAGQQVSGLHRLFAYRPRATDHLNAFTHEVMRGPSTSPPASASSSRR